MIIAANDKQLYNNKRNRMFYILYNTYPVTDLQIL